jgi:hypothetical protein
VAQLVHNFRVINAELRNAIYQYAIKFSNGKEKVLGMPKSSKWNLYAQQLDPFALHEWFGFKLAAASGENAVRSRFCEVGHRLSLKTGEIPQDE